MARTTATNASGETANPPRGEAEIAKHNEIRERFLRDRPTLESLVASGEYNPPIALGEHLGIREAVAALKEARENMGLSLADIAARTGIDKSAVSKIETGQNNNPTVSTLARYARGLGKRWVWSLVEDAAGDDPRSRLSGHLDTAIPAEVADRIRPEDNSAEANPKSTAASWLERIQVPEYVWLAVPRGLGFPAWRVFEVCANPTQRHRLTWEGLEMTTYIRSTEVFADAVILSPVNESLVVTQAFRIHSSLCTEPLASLTPLQILEKFADRFGFEMSTIGIRKRFFLQETVPAVNFTVPGATNFAGINIHNSGKQYMWGFAVKPEPGKVSFAMAFCIDTLAYEKWLKSHGLS